MNGFHSDLSASISAVQLAGRAEGRLYVIRTQFVGGWRSAERTADDKSPKDESLNDFVFVAEFAELEGVQASCHLVDEDSIEQLADFIISNSITWLVIGTWPDKQRAKQNELLGELQKKLQAAPNRFQKDLQIIKAPTLQDKDVNRVMSQSRLLKKISTQKK